MTEKYQLQELDEETRAYLMLAREKRGKGVPGIYAGKTNLLPVLGLILGFAIMIATVLATFPPILPPIKEAMLQTAGFLLGGWMIVAALRVWTGSRTGRYAGHFVYADPETLYEAKGSAIEVTDLADLREAKAVQNFNEGKYQNTSITVKVGKERKTFEVNDEERGRRLAVYLNAVSYMRDGGEDGKDDDLRNLSPEAMGAVAKQVARTGQFPVDPRGAEEDEGVRIPRPKKEGRASTGVLAILVTVVIGALMFFGFQTVNKPFRDEAVFAGIKGLPPKEQPPFLRQYLLNDDFTAHRDEAQQMLDAYYDANAMTNLLGTDVDMIRGLGGVLLALKSKPTAVVSLVVSEDESPVGEDAGRTARENTIQTFLADKWGATIGDEMVVFAAPADPANPGARDRAARGMIELRWKYTAAGGILFTMVFRTSPDEEPIMVRDGSVAAAEGPAAERTDKTAQALADRIIKSTVGDAKLRPNPPPDDF